MLGRGWGTLVLCPMLTVGMYVCLGIGQGSKGVWASCFKMVAGMVLRSTNFGIV